MKQGITHSSGSFANTMHLCSGCHYVYIAGGMTLCQSCQLRLSKKKAARYAKALHDIRLIVDHMDKCEECRSLNIWRHQMDAIGSIIELATAPDGDTTSLKV